MQEFFRNCSNFFLIATFFSLIAATVPYLQQTRSPDPILSTIYALNLGWICAKFLTWTKIQINLRTFRVPVKSFEHLRTLKAAPVQVGNCWPRNFGRQRVVTIRQCFSGERRRRVYSTTSSGGDQAVWFQTRRSNFSWLRAASLLLQRLFHAKTCPVQNNDGNLRQNGWNQWGKKRFFKFWFGSWFKNWGHFTLTKWCIFASDTKIDCPGKTLNICIIMSLWDQFRLLIRTQDSLSLPVSTTPGWNFVTSFENQLLLTILCRWMCNSAQAGPLCCRKPACWCVAGGAVLRCGAVLSSLLELWSLCGWLAGLRLGWPRRSLLVFVVFDPCVGAAFCWGSERHPCFFRPSLVGPDSAKLRRAFGLHAS